MQVEGPAGLPGTATGRTVGAGRPARGRCAALGRPALRLRAAASIRRPRRPARFGRFPRRPSSERVSRSCSPEGVTRAAGGGGAAHGSAESCWSRCAYRERLSGTRACRRAAGASRSGSPSGPRTARCATAEVDAARRAYWPRWRLSWVSSAVMAEPRSRRLSVTYHYERPDQQALARARAAAAALWPKSWPAGGGGRSRPRPSCRRCGPRAASSAGPELNQVAPARHRAGDGEPGASRQRIDGAKERLERWPAGSPSWSSTAEGRRMSTRQERGQGHHRRRGVHRPLGASARVHPGGRRVPRRRAQAGPRSPAHGRDPQGGHPGRRSPSPTSCSRPAVATASIADRLTALADDLRPPPATGQARHWRAAS